MSVGQLVMLEDDIIIYLRDLGFNISGLGIVAEVKNEGHAPYPSYRVIAGELDDLWFEHWQIKAVKKCP